MGGYLQRAVGRRRWNGSPGPQTYAAMYLHCRLIAPRGLPDGAATRGAARRGSAAAPAICCGEDSEPEPRKSAGIRGWRVARPFPRFPIPPR